MLSYEYNMTLIYDSLIVRLQTCLNNVFGCSFVVLHASIVVMLFVCVIMLLTEYFILLDYCCLNLAIAYSLWVLGDELLKEIEVATKEIHMWSVTGSCE